MAAGTIFQREAPQRAELTGYESIAFGGEEVGIAVIAATLDELTQKVGSCLTLAGAHTEHSLFDTSKIE